MKKFLLILVCLGLTSCVFVSQNMNESGLQGIAVGMSKQEVQNSLGEPSQVKTVIIGIKEYESWLYPLERKWAKRFKSVPYTYYEVLFSDDKVARWDRIKLVSQPQYEYREPDPSGKVVTSVSVMKDTEKK
ncbi:MAG: hypothetical protein ABH954_03940 [Candidatus Omnitrophota bacterium]